MSLQGDAAGTLAVPAVDTVDGAVSTGVASGSGGEPLSSQALRGGAFLAARYGLGVLVSLGNMLVMTWWIGPHAYGLFVTAIGLVAFLSTIARAGVDVYLVRCDATPEARTYDVASTLILAISVTLTLAGAAAAPCLMRWYGSREFVLPYLVLLSSVPTTGLTGVPVAKLERRLDFSRLAGIELGGQFLGLIVAAALAWAGMGVWSPVAGQTVWQVSVLIASCLSAGMIPRLRFDPGEARRMLSFGLGLTASLRVWQLRMLVNPLLVGRFSGPEGVAFVGLAIRIAEGLGSLRLAAGRLAIAALARLQDSRQEFRALLEQALRWQVITLGPLLCGFALLGPFIVQHVTGVRWMPSLAVYPFVAAGVLVNSIYNLQASALFVMRRQWPVMSSYLAHVAVLGAGTFLLLPRLGTAGYGWAELLACGAYWRIHRGLANADSSIRHRRFVPWLVAFLMLLFTPAITGGWLIKLP